MGRLMGSSFFKAPGNPKLSGVPQNMEARAIGSSTYAARGATAGANKSLGKAESSGKSVYKPMKRSAAYAKGPKI